MHLPRRRSSTPFVAAVLFVITHTHAARAQVPDALSDLSLEELTSLEVTSVSKRLQASNEVAASVFVLTQDEIRRTGASSLPQALRLVPGLQVAQIDDNKWAISIRGFNGRFANKLLVLKDGRSIYTPTFGGVYWDANDTFIEDVERIEVIRGPGGAMWGANAVNGVINIITKHAGQTDGALLSASSGNAGQANVGLRYGAAMNSDVQWRTYARYSQSDGLSHAAIDHEHADASSVWRSGMRADVRLTSSDEVTVSAEGYDGILAQFITPPWTQSRPPPVVNDRESIDGVVALGLWTHTSADLARLSARLSHTHDARHGSVHSERRDTSEFELQHLLARRGDHLFTWGLTVQSSADRIGRGTHASVSPVEARETRYSAFAQDERFFVDDRASITVGAKLEHSDVNGSHILPTLRARYNSDDSTSYWAAISRGVRRPSRGERTVEFITSAEATPVEVGQSSLPSPLLIVGSGNDQLRSEKLVSYEAGVRTDWSLSAATELSIYYNHYEDARGTQAGMPLCMPSGTPLLSQPECALTSSYFVLPIRTVNSGDTDTYGGELVSHFRPRPDWRITAGYAYLAKDAPTSTIADVLSNFDTRHLATVRSLWALGTSWDVGLSARYVSAIEAMKLPAYTEVDARIAWKPAKQWELALIGRNLLHDEHDEFVSELGDMPLQSIERSVLLQLRWSPL